MEIEVRLLKASDDPSDDILVSRWHVAEGDPVTAGDDLVDVSFDKVDETIPHQSAAPSPKSPPPKGTP